ncbi:MAG: UvrD-helicase domain-containing protein [Anaerolineales bacterium]|nr:UvrD-helicase domain-containing protein [Anaerolineales bacterium]
MHEFLNRLNSQQQAAVSAPPGPVLVLAGPGSGKTRVLTYRIAYLIRALNVAPWHIMAVTFTNKAAREMSERLEQLLGGAPRGLLMGTFHASCARILRRESDNLTYYTRDFVIFDTADQLQVVKQVLKELNLDDKKYRPQKLLGGISSAKNEYITPEEYQTGNYIAEITRRVYTRYQETLRANNAMDFDDLLMNTVLLFDERPDVLARYQQQYQHILVDEFQDTNTVQYALLQRLAGEHGSLFVVGDSDQSIYRWRGADYRNINRFREAYPEAHVVLLEQNYRSTQLILDAAKAIIKRNANRVHKELFTDRAGGSRITLREAYDENDEAEAIVSTIESLLLDGHAPGDVAVMYRTNVQSRALEESFVRRGIPYRVVGATEFYKRREVKDVLAFLRLVHNPLDAVSFGRVINVPPRGIGAKTQETLARWAAANNWQPAEALLHLATNPDLQHPFSARAHNVLDEFGQLLAAWVTLRDQQVRVGDLLEVILEQTNYQEYLEGGARDALEAEERWANVRELLGVAREAPGSLAEFLEQVSLVSEVDNLEEAPSVVSLLTLHAAKGLEFPVVFITGLEDGMLPHSRSLDDAEELAEERRLFYVGLTRAMDRVYLSHAFRRTFYGETEVTVPSRFLNDIPEELVEGTFQAGSRRQQTKSSVSSWSWSGGDSWGSSGGGRQDRATGTSRTGTPAQPAGERKRPLPPPSAAAPETAAPSAPQFRSGQRVRHAKFGEGTVIESKLTGSDEEVHVAFPGHGIKRLAASFARLETIND